MGLEEPHLPCPPWLTVFRERCRGDTAKEDAETFLQKGCWTHICGVGEGFQMEMTLGGWGGMLGGRLKARMTGMFKELTLKKERRPPDTPGEVGSYQAMQDIISHTTEFDPKRVLGGFWAGEWCRKSCLSERWVQLLSREQIRGKKYRRRVKRTFLQMQQRCFQQRGWKESARMKRSLRR